MFGKNIPAPRLTAAFGEDGIKYRYAGMERDTIIEWPKNLLKVKELIEKRRGIKLNYAFVNIYEVQDADGKDVEHYIGWHADKEADIVCDDTGATTIASISLGDERKFQIRAHKRKASDSPTKIHTKVS